MTKKQLGIICTLLALIVCTALLAAKLNKGGLNDPSDLSAVLSSEDNKDNNNGTDATGSDNSGGEKETISQTNFFYEARTEREQKNATTVQSLQAIIDNQNTTKEQKTSASSELQNLVLRQDKQKTIELNIKNKGYEDALCEISDDGKKANIIVKTSASLTEKEGAVMQEIVQNAASIIDVTIEAKK